MSAAQIIREIEALPPDERDTVVKFAVLLGSRPPPTAVDLSKAAGIESTASVNGGDACIANTRIPVWVLAEMRQQGASDVDILEDFPNLTLQNLQDAWDYVESHRAEITAALNAHVEA